VVESKRSEKFSPGFVYFSPHRPPGMAPEGFKWVCTWRHPEKNYPEKWELRPETPNSGGELASNPYGVDPKKMESDWKRATSKKGRPPIGGAQDD
jgi:hypothetical protein